MTAPIRSILDEDLIRRFDVPGPRYTSYPTAVRFHDGFGEGEFRLALARRRGRAPRPLSLYVHVPFCERLCFFCGCNKRATQDRRLVARYLEDLALEIARMGALVDNPEGVRQLHFGGGTPTYLSPSELDEIILALDENFGLASDDDVEFSIEIDPRKVDRALVFELRRLGLNRISLGIQDFDPRVQRAVNRIQPAEDTLSVIDAARDAGFGSVSVDLMYGLPHQTRGGFEKTVERVLEARPDRISLFSYAHLPERFAPQRMIDESALPDPVEKLGIFRDSIESFGAAGYVHIGMDHFALPDDELARALRNGTMQRNFQGYSTRGGGDLIGLGASAISLLDDAYSQNAVSLRDYHECLVHGALPVVRGVDLTDDDRTRRDIIMSLMCRYEVDLSEFVDGSLDAREAFSEEMSDLEQLAPDGLVSIDGSRVRVTDAGKLLIRRVAMAFDAYLTTGTNRYSKVI